MPTLYLWIDIGCIIIPFLASFHPKIRFDKHWRAAFPAIFITAIIFLVWDIWFTKMQVWGFNETYLLGINLINLPLEEVLFFICIPYACLFTYTIIRDWVKKNPLEKSAETIFLILAPILILLGLLNLNQWYTSVTFISLGSFIYLSKYVFGYKNFPAFLLSFLILLIPFFISNGILTGTGIKDQVVWYNDYENLGIRMGTIPIEDTFYGMLFMLMNAVFMEKFSK